MAFWLWAILSALAVIGVLLVAPSAIDDTVLYQGYFGLIFVILALGFGLAGIGVTRPNALFWQIKPVVVTILLGLSVVFFGLRAYQHHAWHTHAVLPITNSSTPLVVTAKVQLFEISDSLYNPALGLPYRQKAILTDIRPYTPKSLGVAENPFGFEGKITSSPLDLPSSLTVLLHAYPHKPSKSKPNDPLADLAVVKVGDELEMTLRLNPILPSQETGFDSYKWLLTRHIHAKADIIGLETSPKPMTHLGLVDRFFVGLGQLREWYRFVFYEKFQKDPNASTAIVLSLLTGDRALIDKPTKELYQYGGISHLLAISGTHVLFLAIVLANGATWLANRRPTVYYHVAKWQLRFVVMAMTALLYALFTGFDVPAVRTVFMLIFVGVLRLLLFRMSAVVSLMAVALIMIAFDPYVVWQAGFWLSFIAVGLLMSYEDNHQSNHVLQTIINLAKLQVYIFVAMLPISLLLFGKVSLLGLVVNLFAVGLFGYVIVPLNLLAGVVYFGMPSLAHGIWAMSMAVLDGLHGLLGALSLTVGRTWLHTPMPVAMVLLFGLMLWVVQSRLIPRLFVLLPLCVVLCALASPKHQVADGAIYLLENSTSTRATLIKSQSEAWLVLSSTAKGHMLNDEKITNELLDKLHKHGVKRLAGVLIQNDNMALARVAGRISLDVPTHRLLWSGDRIHVGNLFAERCQADMQLDMQGMVLEVLTGWHTIADKSMHACHLAVASDRPMMVKMDNATSKTATSLIIDGGRDDRIWQVYHLMCANQEQHAIKPTMIVGGSMSDETLAKFGSPEVMELGR